MLHRDRCRPSSLRAPFVGAALLLALISVGCTRPEPPPPPPPPPPDKVEKDIVDKAFHECFFINCDLAYGHLSSLPATSKLRDSDEVRAILYHYDVDRLLEADIEPDLTKRKALYQAVTELPGIHPLLRTLVVERIARLGVPGAGAKEVTLNATTTAGAEAALESAELSAKAKSKDRHDWDEVRAKIEPKIYSGKATPGDVAMLRTVCKAEKDATCLKQLDKLILR